MWTIDKDCWTCPEDEFRVWVLVGFDGKNLIWEETKDWRKKNEGAKRSA